MNRNEALSKLISVRHYCYAQLRERHFSSRDGYQAAFRTLNSLYVALRDSRPIPRDENT